MCCIIHRPKGSAEIKKEYIEQICRKNPHGWGIAYAQKNGKIKVEKSMDMSQAFDKIRELEKANKEFLFHARWATHGEKNLENCHPYDLADGHFMFHNGRIQIKEWNKKMSDSYHFAFRCSKFLRKGWSFEAITKMYEKSIGESRLAFIGPKSKIFKIGKWEELDGCFYSKTNWKWESTTTTYNRSTYTPSTVKNTNTHYTSTSNKFADIKERLRNSKPVHFWELQGLDYDDLLEIVTNHSYQVAVAIYDRLHPQTVKQLGAANG